MTEHEMILRAMRMMAWERAKGEMLSMLQTHQQKNGGGISQEFISLKSAIDDFVENVEGNGLHE